MARNQRIYYAIHTIGFAPLGTVINNSGFASTGYRAAKGVQSVGLNTTFNLEQVFQLGQLSLYENIEQIPDIEVTAEKVLDGYALLEHLSTPVATVSTLAGRYNDNRCMLAIAYYDMTNTFSTGIPLSTVIMSGMYLSSLNFNIPVVGSMRESVSWVGNDKVWNFTPSGIPWTSGTMFTGNESPVLASGGVLQRENVIHASSFWPKEIPGIDVNGVNQLAGASGYAAHIQNVTISVNLGRTSLFELGRKGPYFRYAEFPTEVTTTVELTSDERGDAVNARENTTNLSDQRIYVYLEQGIVIDLGTKNKLRSITHTGGDTGGGNKTTTYTYSTFNDLTVTSPADPAGL